MSATAITLNPADKVAEGGERRVFVHPDDATRLIKILKPRHASEFTRWTFGHLSQRYIPAARYRPTVKQYDEYRRVMFDHLTDPHFIPPIAHLYGFVATNLGLGAVSERVTDADGNNAPTLEQLVKAGQFSNDDLAGLNAFVATLYDVSICGADLGPANFVYGHRHIGAKGAQSDPQWVLVDGFGDRFAIPIRSISRRVRTLGLDDSFKRAKKVAGLRWNPPTRSFQLA